LFLQNPLRHSLLAGASLPRAKSTQGASAPLGKSTLKRKHKQRRQAGDAISQMAVATMPRLQAKQPVLIQAPPWDGLRKQRFTTMAISHAMRRGDAPQYACEKTTWPAMKGGDLCSHAISRALQEPQAIRLRRGREATPALPQGAAGPCACEWAANMHEQQPQPPDSVLMPILAGKGLPKSVPRYYHSGPKAVLYATQPQKNRAPPGCKTQIGMQVASQRQKKIANKMQDAGSP
jgi:hypothetical protein